MGWWGMDIMGGDGPADWEHVIRDICQSGYEAFPDHEDLPDLTEQILYDYEDAIAAKAAEVDDPLFYEVWGHLLTEAKSESLRDDRREAIVAAIDKDMAAIPEQGWSDPAERRYHLRVLRDKVEILGTGRVVSLDRHIKLRLREEVEEAMQGAFACDGLSDPSVVQRAVSRFLEDLTEGVEFTDWGVAAQAIVNVGKAMATAIKSGITVKDAVEVARPLTGV